jgi:hypothetical protein
MAFTPPHAIVPGDVVVDATIRDAQSLLLRVCALSPSSVQTHPQPRENTVLHPPARSVCAPA